MANETQLQAAVLRYTRLGIDTFPLMPLQKTPLIKAWQTRKPYQMWRKAPANANIAIRTSGDLQLAVIDCDDKNQPGTYDRVVALLNSLGLQPNTYPVVQTASGVGRHIYLRLHERLNGSISLLTGQLGAGEFRYGTGAYVVAAPSIMDDGSVYTLIAGDFGSIPVVSALRLFPALCGTAPDLSISCEKNAKIPRSAWPLLKGRHIDQYRSRSDAEQALITILVNAGLAFPDIQALFQTNPCAGRYSEQRQESPPSADKWLQHSYEAAVDWTSKSESEACQKAHRLHDWASARAWPGRGGHCDQSVFLAHVEIMRRAGRDEYAAAVRDLADLANVSAMTASRSTKRLVEQGLLKIIRKGSGDYAAQYAICCDRLLQTGTLPHTGGSRECTSLNILSDDVFTTRTGLGKTAGQIWLALVEHGPQTEKGLAQRTGRCLSTIRRNLQKMASITDRCTGTVYNLVSRKGDCWHANSVPLPSVAEAIGAAGCRERRRKHHQQERMAHFQHFRKKSQATEQGETGAAEPAASHQ